MWKRKTSTPPATHTGSFSPKERAFVAKHCHTLTTVEIATQLGRSYGSVQGYLEKSAVRQTVVKRRNSAPFISMPDTILAYIAGLVDGEGTITITKRGQPEISITNTSDALAEWCKNVGFWLNRAKNTKQRPYWRLNLTGYSIIDALEKLLPYLVIKKPHAELVIEYITLRRSMPHRFKRSERMDEIIAAIRELNTRGRPVSPSTSPDPSSSTT